MSAPVQLPCPSCGARLQVPASAARTTCGTCRRELECLFLRPGAVVAAPAGRRDSGRVAAAPGVGAPATSRWGECTNHPTVGAVGRCIDCARGMCALCRFELPQGRYCADCATRPRQGGGGTTAAAASVGLAVVSAATFFGLMIYAAAQGPHMSQHEQARFQMLDMVVTKGVHIATAVGIMLGFVSTDEARRNVLGIIGIVLNALLLGILVLILIFVAMGGAS